MKGLELEFGPGAALRGLFGLHGVAERERWPLGDKLRAQLAGEVARVEKSLAVLGGAIEWLEHEGFAVVVRDKGAAGKGRKGHGGAEGPAFLHPIRVALDARALVRGVREEGEAAPQGAWHVTAFALRALLTELRTTALLAVRSVRANKRASDLALVLHELDVMFAHAGLVAGGSASAARARGETARAARGAPRARPKRAGADEKKTAGRRRAAGTPRHAAPSHARKAPHAATARRGKSATRASAAPPPRARANAAPPPRPHARNAAPPPKGSAAPPPRGRRAAAGGAGFGGLPDDAQPEDRTAQSPMGPRGVTMDAEFFLQQAGIANWPCAAADLDRARKQVLARLHPDRMGEASTALFQRAVRGHTELARKLAARASAASPSATPPPPPASTTAGAGVPRPAPAARTAPARARGATVGAANGGATPRAAAPANDTSAPPRSARHANRAAPPPAPNSPVGEWPPAASAAW